MLGGDKKTTPEESFYSVKQPIKRSEGILPPIIDPDSVSWRNIKPDKQYATVRKLFFED